MQQAESGVSESALELSLVDKWLLHDVSSEDVNNEFKEKCFFVFLFCFGFFAKYALQDSPTP